MWLIKSQDNNERLIPSTYLCPWKEDNLFVIMFGLKNFYLLDSGCHPDGTYYMEVNGKCHCNQGFIGDSCDEFCPEGQFGTPPYCQGSIFL